jgi:hypothetical protein
VACAVAFACRENWQKYASQQGGRGGYLRFANMLINDSIYLLDESLKYVKVSMSARVQWHRAPAHYQCRLGAVLLTALPCEEVCVAPVQHLQQ